VFENVISNAVQYSDGVCEAVIEIDVKEGGYEVRVSDKGIGIPKNEQKHVFEKFYRSEEAIKKEAGNVGLGLYLVKSIVNILGGEIRFESVEGEGTTFFITLPKAVSK
jgi:signal transduction histidine kinase